MDENEKFNPNRCEKQDEWVDELLSLLPYSCQKNMINENI